MATYKQSVHNTALLCSALHRLYKHFRTAPEQKLKKSYIKFIKWQLTSNKFIIQRFYAVLCTDYINNSELHLHRNLRNFI